MSGTRALNVRCSLGNELSPRRPQSDDDVIDMPKRLSTEAVIPVQRSLERPAPGNHGRAGNNAACPRVVNEQALNALFTQAGPRIVDSP
jgi:hypothetical protein